MSDQKKLNKRLSDLFADLEGEITQPPDEEKELSGWTWEIDSDGRYSHCSPEVKEILGVKPEDFLGERLTTFRLAAGSQGRLTASLESKQPKSELTLQFLTAAEFFISARMYIIYIPADDGVEEHWRGFAQIIQDETTPEPASPPPLSLSSISSLSIPEGIA
nr:PAS domain-containing protein [Chloroflexota bacterium]